MPNSIKCFTDIAENDPDTAFLLNQDLNQIQRWSEKWLVKFNPNKTETMVISSKRNKPYHPLTILAASN
jgi:ABC-type antimicrobial peptide transport system ATPase subunit